MATREEQIAALSQLMMNGLFTAEEFGRMVKALNSDGPIDTPAAEMSPAQRTYETYIHETVAKAFKSPSAVKCPPFNPDMVKYGTIKLDNREQTLKYIETYVDAPNSYGTMLRENIIIGIDDDFNPLFWAQHLNLGMLLGKSKGWTTMSKR